MTRDFLTCDAALTLRADWTDESERVGSSCQSRSDVGHPATHFSVDTLGPSSIFVSKWIRVHLSE